MESLSAEGSDWQVLRVSGRRAGRGSSTFVCQKMDEWDGCRCDRGCHGHYHFIQSILIWHQRTIFLGCQPEL
jgi:hypothetical protein